VMVASTNVFCYEQVANEVAVEEVWSGYDLLPQFISCSADCKKVYQSISNYQISASFMLMKNCILLQ